MATGVEELASVINNLEGLLTFRKKQHDIIEEGEAAMGKLKGPNSEPLQHRAGRPHRCGDRQASGPARLHGLEANEDAAR